MRPVLLVDIDGVRAPYGSDSPPSGFTPYDLFPEDGGPTYLCTLHGQWLKELGSRFEIIWASDWGYKADRLLSPLLNLPHWPHIKFPTAEFAPADKIPAIHAFVSGQPCAWLDDMVSPVARSWAAQQEAPTLLIDVNPTLGLTRDMVGELLNWSYGILCT